MRVFMRRRLLLFILVAGMAGLAGWMTLRGGANVPVAIAPPTVVDDTLNVPLFSHRAGFFSEEFLLTLSGAGAGEVIRFTVDGSAPTVLSPVFDAPIRIHSPGPALHTSPLTQGVLAGAVPRPYYNGMVVRARIFDEHNSASEIVTQSFFVARPTQGRIRGEFDMRVVSISVEPSYFIGAAGMYSQYNVDIRRPAYVEIFYPDGAFMLSQGVRLHVSGNWSRRERQKSLRLNFHAGDGILYSDSLIPDSPGIFRTVTLRTADLHNTTMREALVAQVASPLQVDVFYAVPAAVFVNGEFWGVYCLREQRSNTYLAARHDVDARDILLLDFAWSRRNSGDHTNCTDRFCQAWQRSENQIYPLNPCFRGVHGPDSPFYPWTDENGILCRSHPLFRVGLTDGNDEAYAFYSWMRMYNAIVLNDMSNEAEFAAAMQWVCLDSLLDFFIVYYHFDNWDWPGNNWLTWKVPGGQWRFMLHDFDNALWMPRRNGMNLFTTAGMGAGAGTWDAPTQRIRYYHDNQPLWAVEIWRSLLESATFRNALAARYATYLGTVLHPMRIIGIINELADAREADLPGNFYRWNKHGGHLTHSMAGWHNAVEHLRYFARVRGEYGLRHMQAYFNRTDRPNLALGLGGEMIQITFRTQAGAAWDIAGAHITPDLMLVNTFTAAYIWGLPFAITALPPAGHAFSHMEIEAGVGLTTIYTNPLPFDLSGLAPPPGTSAITITAVFVPLT